MTAQHVAATSAIVGKLWTVAFVESSFDLCDLGAVGLAGGAGQNLSRRAALAQGEVKEVGVDVVLEGLCWLFV